MPFSKNPRENIAYEVRGTFRAFENALISLLAEKDLSVGFFHILRLPWPEEGMSQKQIADLAFMTPSVASQLIKKMCKANLLMRETDKIDIRKKIVCLTEEGKAKKEALLKPILNIPKIASMTVSDEDVITTLKVLAELRRNLKNIET
jgi:DNA-binding MarR family transcriptional regulator